MDDVYFCPICGGMVEAGGDSGCFCEDYDDDTLLDIADEKYRAMAGEEE